VIFASYVIPPSNIISGSIIPPGNIIAGSIIPPGKGARARERAAKPDDRNFETEERAEYRHAGEGR